MGGHQEVDHYKMKKKHMLIDENRAKDEQFIYKGIFIILILLFLSVPSTFANLKDENIMYCSLDNSTYNDASDTFLDSSGNDNNLTRQNAVQGQEGKINQAVWFDGNEDTLSNASYAPFTQWNTQNFSLFMWINMSNTPTEGIFASRGTITAPNNQCSAGNSHEGCFSLYLLDGQGFALGIHTTNGFSTLDSMSGNSVETSEYQHIGFVYNSTGVQFYINSTEVADSALTGSLTGLYDFRIGYRGAGGPYFNGFMDEISLWNRSLNLSEVVELYNNGIGNNPYTISNFTLRANDPYLDESILNFSAIVNGTNYNSNLTSGVLTTPILENATSLFNWTIYLPNYFNFTFINYSIAINGSDYVALLTYNYSRHNVTAFIQPDNLTSIINFTVTTDEGFSGNTTNGSVIVTNTWNKTINIIIDADGNGGENFTTGSETSDGFQNEDITFYLFREHTFSLRFIDEIRNVLMNFTNITLNLISDSFGNNYSTDNGTMLIESVIPEEYILRYGDLNSEYFERNYYITLLNGSANSLNLYLLNNSYPNLVSATGVTTIVKDSLNTDLEGVIINVNKYFSLTNSYETVERLSTNFEGQTLAYLTNDEFYRFVIDVDGDIVLSTTSTMILESTLNFIVDLIEDPTERFKKFRSISTDITYTNSTKLFSLTYNDPNNFASEICLKTYETGLVANALIDSSCSASQSGTLFASIPAEGDKSYIAKAFATIDGIETLLDQSTVSFKGGEAFDFGDNGLFMVILLTLVFATIGIFNPVVMLLLTPLPLLLGSVLGFVTIPVGVSIAIYAAFIVIVIVIGRRA